MDNKDKNDKSVVLKAVDSEDKKMIRRIIVQGGICEDDSLSYTKADFNKAFLKEQPMVMKVPKKQVDIIKKNYLEFLENNNNQEKDNEQE